MRDLELQQTIMVVDDDDITREMLSVILAELGKVELAKSGEEALEKVGNIEPDLIILDVQMYEMDGYTVCQRLKANEQTSDIPVVFLTGSNTNEDEELGLDVGATDFIRKPISPKIVLARTSNILKLRAATRELERLAATDPLTGAFNRRRFLEVGNAELRRSKRYKKTFSVLMLDIDHFKVVNDTYGHSIGDTALKETVTVIQNAMRAQDILGRLGGEEFAVLVPESHAEDAAALAERIRASIAQIVIDTPDEPLSFTMSIGVSEGDNDDDSVDDALTRADKALYDAKEQGRNQVVCA